MQVRVERRSGGMGKRGVPLGGFGNAVWNGPASVMVSRDASKRVRQRGQRLVSWLKRLGRSERAPAQDAVCHRRRVVTLQHRRAAPGTGALRSAGKMTRSWP